MRIVIQNGTVKLKDFIFTVKKWDLHQIDLISAIREAELEMDRIERMDMTQI